MKTGVVFEGGGMRGLFTAGVIEAMLDLARYRAIYQEFRLIGTEFATVEQTKNLTVMKRICLSLFALLLVIGIQAAPVKPVTVLLMDSANSLINGASILANATLLARRWESALLVNVDNATLSRLLASQEAMNALMNIEAFRGLNSDIETIINKSEAVKKTKKERGEDLTPKEKKELTAEEKEYKAKRKAIQEKLIKFATRIPVFMYLTDFREYTLNDVIHQLEPELFRKVTGLNLSDFDLLVSLGVFNRELMNDAVYKFKRYEDSSLVYTGINTHAGENVGGFDTVISEETFKSQIPVADLSSSIISEESDDNLEEVEDDSVDNEEVNPWLSCKVGDMVEHKTFGKGMITALEDKYMWVKFISKEKKFVFPDCFEKGFFHWIGSLE